MSSAEVNSTCGGAISETKVRLSSMSAPPDAALDPASDGGAWVVPPQALNASDKKTHVNFRIWVLSRVGAVA